MLKNQETIDKMSLEQKAKLTIGKDYWNTQNYDELGIPSIKMTDGPNGLRIQRKKRK
jgi:beta-glucosidase